MRKILFASTLTQGFLFLVGFILPVLYLLNKLISIHSIQYLSQSPVKKAFINSLIFSSSSALISTFLAFLFSWILYRFHFAYKDKILFLLKIPYLFPPFLFAMAWIALAAPQVGAIQQITDLDFSIYGLLGASFVFTLWAVAFGAIQFKPFFETLPSVYEEAALLCGASPRKAFLKILFPLAKPQVLSCFLLTFLSGLSAFGIPALLSSPARDYMLTTRIYQAIKTSGGFDQHSEAGILSFSLLFISLVVLGLQYFITKKSSFSFQAGKGIRSTLLKPHKTEYLLFIFCMIFVFTSVVLPSFALLHQSFLQDRSQFISFSILRYKYVFFELPEVWQCLENSALTAFLAACVAGILALFVAYHAVKKKNKLARILIEISSLSYALPGTVLALALLVFFSRSLADTLWILALAYFIKYVAFVLKTLTPATSSISNELEEAAALSGATPFQSFTLIFAPLLQHALVASILLASIPMFSELTMSVLLAGAGTETLGVLLYRFQEYADPSSACVLACLLVLLILSFNFIVKKTTRGKLGI